MRVEHEPLHNAYQPRKMLGLQSPEELGAELAASILEHIDSIERTVLDRPYIECGHPCWSTIPYLTRRFGERVRILLLIREPVATALSWLTHQAYCAPLAPHLKEKVLLSPFDAGVAYPAYRERWNFMQPFEKCLYFWLEVNALGERLKYGDAAPMLRVSVEKLLQSDSSSALEQMLDFLELPIKPEFIAARSQRVDAFRYVAHLQPDTSAVHNHPEVLKLAACLGY